MQNITKCCGIYGNANRSNDLNSDWTCKRMAHHYGIARTIADIENMEKRVTKLYGRKRTNLEAWIVDAKQRLARLVEQVSEVECSTK